MSRKNGCKNMAVKARRGHNADEAWFYENPRSIEVYIRKIGQQTVSCRITREQLKDWLLRTDVRALLTHLRTRAQAQADIVRDANE